MGEESSLFSFFFYVLFVYPATNWILKPGRFSRSKGLTYAVGLLVAIAAVGMKTSLRRILDVGGQAIALIIAETVFIAGFILAGIYYFT